MNNFTILDHIIVDRIDRLKPNPKYRKFVARIEDARNNDENINIQISDVENHLIYKLFAFQELIKNAKENINIFSRNLPSQIYDNPHILYHLSEWLKAGEDRKIKVLLKESVDLKGRSIGAILCSEYFKDRISIEVSNLREIDQCYRSCVLFDDNAFMAGEANPSGDIEIAIFNFHDKKAVNSLSRVYNAAYNLSKETNPIQSEENIVESKINEIIHSSDPVSIPPYFVAHNIYQPHG